MLTTTGPDIVDTVGMDDGCILNPERIAEYAANPVKKRDDCPQMPPQSHLDDETRLAAARFMLQVTN